MISPQPPRRLAWRHADAGVLAFGERAFYPPGFRFPLHRHAFAEAFLVERGSGLHRVGGDGEALAAGDLVLVHPDAAHAVEAGREALVFVNLSFAPPVFRALQARYRRDVARAWPAGGVDAVRLDGASLRALGERFGELEAEGECRDRLRVESLALECLRLARAAAVPRSSLPRPLVRALAALDDDSVPIAGPGMLARRAGWSREHLNREVRRHLGTTTIALVSRRRLDHAARLLRHTDRDVREIARACGLANLSHFYARFRARFGCTPSVFRGTGGADAV